MHDYFATVSLLLFLSLGAASLSLVSAFYFTFDMAQHDPAEVVGATVFTFLFASFAHFFGLRRGERRRAEDRQADYCCYLFHGGSFRISGC